MAGNYERTAPAEADSELLKYKRWYREDVVVANKWRKEAKEDFQFRDGHQWSREDKQVLEDQGRPVITFNRTGVLVDAVVGLETGNRRETRFIPREPGDSIANELLTSAADWFRDSCDAEDEESEAFKDTVTAGMGWTETRLDRTNNPDGEPKIERVDPFEMVWSASASKANLVDSKRLWRVRSMSIEEARKLAPDASDDDLNAAWADAEEDDEPSRSPATYDKEVDGPQGDRRKVTVVQCQYREEETYYKAVILSPPAMQPMQVDLDADKFKIAKKAGAVLQSVKLTRERVMQCLLGAKVLKKPVPTSSKQFTWACITGLKDHDKGIFYGIVRRAKDPQRWANKWLSQVLHILNSQAKGGIMAERDAFDDQREAEESWARSERITWMSKGALSAPSAKVQPKPGPQFPAGFDRLMHYADEMIVKATGVNMELLGMREVNQPGVLEQHRKQSGMGILASFFDSLRRYRKIQGRGMLVLIQEHLADGRLVRIVGDDRARFVPLTKEAVANIEYDIIVDDAPSSPNEKEKNWATIMQMLPILKDMVGPSQAMVLAKYAPLPASFVEELKQSMGNGQDPQAQAQQQLEQQKMAMESQKLQLEMAKIAAEEKKTAAEIQKIQIEAQISMMEQETERMRIAAEERNAALAAMKPQPASLPN